MDVSDSASAFDSDTSDEERQLREVQQLDGLLEAEKNNPLLLKSGLNAKSYFAAITGQIEKNQKEIDIENFLALNKMYSEKLATLEQKLIERLKICREKQRNLTPTPVQNTQESLFRYVYCGKPYFRDKDNFPAPDNEDTILMRKSEMFDYSNINSVPGWTVKDKSILFQILLKISRCLKEKEINSKIAQLKRDVKGKKKGAWYHREMSSLVDELLKVRKRPLSEVALPIDQDYDWDAIALTLNRRHNSQEYKNFWKLYLHPSINKTCWATEEHLALEKIAHANNFQDWDKIAKELNTGRSGYQCFVYFRSNVSSTMAGQKWTKEEELYLRRLIHFYKESDYIPWGKIAASIDGRTKLQVYNKYLRLTEVKKGRFLPEEDAVILTCSENFGPNFKRMAKYLPGRSATQIRMRHSVLTNKQTKTSVVWTSEEDKKLIQIMSNQNSSTYSSIMEHFPGKDRVQIRARYVTLVKWMRKHPNRDISLAPRRGARRLCHGHAETNIDKALENLKNRIQTEVAKTKHSKITSSSRDEQLDAVSMAFLINEKYVENEFCKLEKCDSEDLPLKNESEVEIKPNASDIHKLLILLKAKLNKKYFEKSLFAETYPDLLRDHIDCLVKVKSYSKVAKVKSVVLDEQPDIWGERPLTASEFVLPPNYDTITGCIKLMALALRKPEQRIMQFNALCRRNILCKQNIELLIERFHTLFVWPLLISNQALDVNRYLPPPKSSSNVSNKPQGHSDPVSIGCAIPARITRQSKRNPLNTSEEIDLEQDDEIDNNVINVHVGNADFMYMSD